MSGQEINKRNKTLLKVSGLRKETYNKLKIIHFFISISTLIIITLILTLIVNLKRKKWSGIKTIKNYLKMETRGKTKVVTKNNEDPIH